MSLLQSIVFKKKYFTLAQAMDFLERHFYHTTFRGKGVDEKMNTYRFRQHEPLRKLDKKHKFYTSKKISPGITFIFISYK